MRLPAFAFAAAVATLTSSPASAKPRLAVLVVFDQMRAVEVDRYAPFFGPGGFGGLDGARFDAYYDYGDTETGPGHATLATGANPSVHGVATNTWFVNGEKHYVVDDPDFPVLGAEPEKNGKIPGRSSKGLEAPTLGDTMKADSSGRAKVVTVSLKDRAAILSGGPSADIAVWYDPAQGRFTTSKAYADKLPPWLEAKGASLPAATIGSAKWSPLPVPKGLEYLVPADDRPGEGNHEGGFGATFPHDLVTAPEALKKKLYRMTPQAMDDTFAMALAAVDELALGKDDEPDYLVVSVSTTDYIGHNYGPESLEQLDTLRRADLALRKFVSGLEARLLARSFVVAVTADHGSLPVQLAAEDEKWPHGIVVNADVADVARKAVERAFPKETKKRVLDFMPPQLLLDTADMAAADRRKMYDVIIEAVEAMPGVARVYDFTVPGDVDEYAPMMRASYVPGRQSPIYVRQKPRVVFMDNKERTGTDHGTPYVYDRRVPVIFAGPGVRRGRYAQPIDPRDVAPTLAFLLGVPPPDMCQGKPVVAVGD